MSATGGGHDQLGSRLAKIRQTLGLSQRQLAKRSGIANATISQIEAGQLNPTVGTLHKIVTSLPMTMSAFFAEDDSQADDKVFFGRDDLVDLSEGLVSYRQVGRNLADRAIQLLWERYEPGGDTGRHPLRHEGEECGFVIRGELTVTVEGETRTLRAGEAYYFRSDKAHSFRNKSDTICELVTASTPPTF